MLDLINVIIVLLIANAIVHLLSFNALNIQKAANRWTVFAFAIINLLLVFFLKMGYPWARYLAIIFPLIGGIGLLTQLSKSTSPKWMDYTILLLDALIIVLLIYTLLAIGVANEPQH